MEGVEWGRADQQEGDGIMCSMDGRARERSDGKRH